MRSKEDSHDYRYFPDPDLLPFEFDYAFVDACRAATLPDMYSATKRARAVEALEASATIMLAY